MTHSLDTGFTAVVLGASGAIGQAWLALLQADSRCAHVVGLSRQSDPPLVLEDEASLVACAGEIRKT